MDVSRKNSRQQTLIRISGECTIYHAETGKALLLADDSGLARKVVLNLENVSELDCAGVQLLLMLQRLVSAAGGSLSLQASNELVQDVFATLRLSAPFNAGEARP